jgi:hypothetical protein
VSPALVWDDAEGILTLAVVVRTHREFAEAYEAWEAGQLSGHHLQAAAAEHGGACRLLAKQAHASEKVAAAVYRQVNDQLGEPSVRPLHRPKEE